MVTSKVYSEEIREAVLDLLWGLWTELGVSGWPRRPVTCAIDVESLIVFTGALGGLDPRLRNESLDWCIMYQRFISTSRLRNIVRSKPSAQLDGWGSYAAIVNTHASVKWPQAAKSRPFTPSGKSRITEFHRPALLPLRLRSIFGVGARAEIVQAFLSTPRASFTASELASSVHFTKRKVADTLESMTAGGLTVPARVKNTIRYRLSNPGSLIGMAEPLPPSFPRWDTIFDVVFFILDFAQAADRLKPEVAAMEARHGLRRLGTTLDVSKLPDPPLDVKGVAFWEAYRQWSLTLLHRLVEFNLPDQSMKHESGEVKSFPVRLQWGGQGELQHEAGLLLHGRWACEFSLEGQLRSNKFLDFELQVPSGTIPAPGELPFEGYRFSGTVRDTGQEVSMENAYCIGYRFEEDGDTITLNAESLEIEQPGEMDTAVYFVPDLALGFDTFSSVGKHRFRSVTPLEVHWKGEPVRITLAGNPDALFTDQQQHHKHQGQIVADRGFVTFTGGASRKPLIADHLESRKTFTLQLTVHCQPPRLKPYDADALADQILDLIGFACGVPRPWIVAEGYSGNQLVRQKLQNRFDAYVLDNRNPSHVIPVHIPYQLSGFIQQVFPTYSALSCDDRQAFRVLFRQASIRRSSLSFPVSLLYLRDIMLHFIHLYRPLDKRGSLKSQIGRLFGSVKMDFDAVWVDQFVEKTGSGKWAEAGTVSDYQVFVRMLSLIHRFTMHALGYQGKFYDWSTIPPEIGRLGE